MPVARGKVRDLRLPKGIERKRARFGAPDLVAVPEAPARPDAPGEHARVVREHSAEAAAAGGKRDARIVEPAGLDPRHVCAREHVAEPELPARVLPAGVQAAAAAHEERVLVAARRHEHRLPAENVPVERYLRAAEVGARGGPELSVLVAPPGVRAPVLEHRDLVPLPGREHARGRVGRVGQRHAHRVVRLEPALGLRELAVKVAAPGEHSAAPRDRRARVVRARERHRVRVCAIQSRLCVLRQKIAVFRTMNMGIIFALY